MSHLSLRCAVALMAAVLPAASSFPQGAPGPATTDTAPKGALVDTVVAGGPAARAGISAHDVITAVEGTAVENLKQVAEALARHKPGDTMELTVARSSDRAITEVTLTLGADPTDASRPYMGLTLLGYLFFFFPPQGGTPPPRAEQQPGV
jgi:S1-C subfamily serine protease